MPRTSILRIAISLVFASSLAAFAQAQPAPAPQYSGVHNLKPSPLGASVDFLVKVKASGVPRAVQGVELVCEVHGGGSAIGGAVELVRFVPPWSGGDISLSANLRDASFRDFVSLGKATYSCRFAQVIFNIKTAPMTTLPRGPGAVFDAKGVIAARTTPKAPPVTVPLALIVVSPPPWKPPGG